MVGHERRYGHPTRDEDPAPRDRVASTSRRSCGRSATRVRLEIVRLLADDRPRVCGELSTPSASRRSTGSYHLSSCARPASRAPRPQGTLRLISLRRDDLEARFPGLVGVLTR